MNFDLSILLQGVIILLLVGGIKGVFAMNQKLNKMNGSIGQLWTWKEGHERLNLEQSKTTEKNITALWDQWNEAKK